MEQKKCKACGKEIREGAKFCKYCGALQTEPESNQCAADKPAKKKPAKQQKLTVIVFAAVVLALLLVVGGLVGYIVWDHANQPGNSELNRIEQEDEERDTDEDAQPKPIETAAAQPEETPAAPEADETAVAQPEETPAAPESGSTAAPDTSLQPVTDLDSCKTLYGAFLDEQGTDFSMDVQGIGLMDVNRDGTPDLVLVRGEFEPCAEIYTANSSGGVELVLDYIDLGWGNEKFNSGSFGALRCYNGTTYIYGYYEGDGFYGILSKINSDFSTTTVLTSDSYDDFIDYIVEMQNTQTLEAACLFVELESYGEKDLAKELQAVEYYNP